MGDNNIERLKSELEKEKALRITAEQKLEDSKSAFYNAIDQLRKEKSQAETDSQEKANELEDFSRFSDQSPFLTLRMSQSGDVLYTNSFAKDFIANLKEDTRLSVRPLFYKKLEEALSSNSNISQSFKVESKVFHVNFVPHTDLKSVNIFGIDITEQDKMRNYFETLSEFSNSLLEANDEEAMAWSITHNAISKLGYVDCVVYLKDRATGSFIQRAAYGTKSPTKSKIVGAIKLKPGQGIVGHVAQSKKGEYVGDVSKDPRYIPDDEVRFSEITVPIIIHDEVVGIIDSEHPEKNYYTDDDLNILTAIASATATRLQKILALKDLETGEQRFKYFVENAFGGIYIIRNEKFEYVNDPLCEIVGFSREEILDSDFDFLKLVNATDPDAISALKERNEGDDSPKSYKLEIKSGTNEIRHLAVNTKVLTDEKGKHTLGILLDITFIEESRKQLRQLNKVLEKKNMELDQFAHLASHNLRAPVANLTGLLEHLNQEDLGNEENQFIIEAFEKTVKSLDLTLEEMHEVLEVRAEHHDKFYKVNFEESLANVTTLIKDQISQSGAQIKCNFNVVEIQYVKSHIENIMLNMLTNAIKYSSPNRPPLIEIEAFFDDEFVKLEFKDNGLGINLERHGEEIFGMYKRFHSHPDSRGLGLYLIKTQLDSLGGEINVQSEVGTGSVFTVSLPTK